MKDSKKIDKQVVDHTSKIAYDHIMSMAHKMNLEGASRLEITKKIKLFLLDTIPKNDVEVFFDYDPNLAEQGRLEGKVTIVNNQQPYIDELYRLIGNGKKPKPDSNEKN